eukprot:355265-Chlamydomonas_euryale.AAC.8
MAAARLCARLRSIDRLTHRSLGQRWHTCGLNHQGIGSTSHSQTNLEVNLSDRGSELVRNSGLRPASLITARRTPTGR